MGVGLVTDFDFDEASAADWFFGLDCHRDRERGAENILSFPLKVFPHLPIMKNQNRPKTKR